MKPDDPPTPAEEPTVDVPNGSEPEVTAEHAHGSPPSTHEGHDAAPGMTRFGGYTIIGVLGEGGMGLVYRARQDRPQREVALKVIRPGVVTDRLRRRFEQEVEVLGRLKHPGIAQVFDAGVDETTGSPYFAMELVEGVTLAEYAESRTLGTRERLRLLAKVCHAVHHAHQKGVIHRDLKPSNILVTETVRGDGQIETQPKILDFGVARATDADIQTTTLQTDVGQLIGTVPYMSPEQVAGDPAELDTRSDVYALGVVLYELLVGRLPYDLKNRMIHEAARVIREEDPTRLSSLNTKLRGDVETIVGKALEKDKDRRYQSAADLASDIDRYLGDEPIGARPPSTWYQLSKFARRNRALVGGVAATFLVLVAGIVGTTTYALKAESQRQDAETARTNETIAKQDAITRAEEAEAARQRALAAEQETQRELTRANEVKRLITEMLASVNPMDAAGSDITLLKRILDDAAARLNDGQVEDELIAAELHQVIGEVYRELALFPEAERHLPRAVAIYERRLGQDHRRTLSANDHVAILYRILGRMEEAERLHVATLDTSRRVLGEDAPPTLRFMNHLAIVYTLTGRYEEAQQLLEDAFEINQAKLGAEDLFTLAVMDNLVVALRQAGPAGRGRGDVLANPGRTDTYARRGSSSHAERDEQPGHVLPGRRGSARRGRAASDRRAGTAASRPRRGASADAHDGMQSRQRLLGPGTAGRGGGSAARRAGDSGRDARRGARIHPRLEDAARAAA